MLLINKGIEASYLVVIAFAMTGLSCMLYPSESVHYHGFPMATFSNVE